MGNVKIFKFNIVWFCVQYIFVLCLMICCKDIFTRFDVCILLSPLILVAILTFFKSVIIRIVASFILSVYSILGTIIFMLSIKNTNMQFLYVQFAIIYTTVFINMLISIHLLVLYNKNMKRNIYLEKSENNKVCKYAQCSKIWFLLHSVFCFNIAVNIREDRYAMYMLTMGIVLLFSVILLESKYTWIRWSIIFSLWVYSTAFAIHMLLVYIWFCVDRISVFTFLLPIIIIANFLFLLNHNRKC